MKKLTKEEIEKAISEAIIAHNDLCTNDIECIPHHRVMPVVSKALSGVGEEEEKEDYRKFPSSSSLLIDMLDEDDDELICYCGECKQRLTLVRSGKHQCDNPECIYNKSNP